MSGTSLCVGVKCACELEEAALSSFLDGMLRTVGESQYTIDICVKDNVNFQIQKS
jgi:hypothetical protein